MHKFILVLYLLVSSSVLMAQSKPAYSIAEISLINPESYQKDLWPKIQKLVRDAGGQIIVSGGRNEAILGGSKVIDRFTIIKFNSYQMAKDFYASKSYIDLKPLAEKSVKIKLYIVEAE